MTVGTGDAVLLIVSGEKPRESKGPRMKAIECKAVMAIHGKVVELQCELDILQHTLFDLIADSVAEPASSPKTPKKTPKQSARKGTK